MVRVLAFPSLDSAVDRDLPQALLDLLGKLTGEGHILLCRYGWELKSKSGATYALPRALAASPTKGTPG